MPYCKNCHSRLSKFDNDICPVCGTVKPLEGVTSDTVEITTQIEKEDNTLNSNICFKKKLLLFFIFIGFTGLPFFYLKNKKMGVIWVSINSVILFAMSFLFAFIFEEPSFIALAILLAFVVVYIINIVTGMIYYTIPNLRDGEGEFVR